MHSCRCRHRTPHVHPPLRAGNPSFCRGSHLGLAHFRPGGPPLGEAAEARTDEKAEICSDSSEKAYREDIVVRACDLLNTNEIVFGRCVHTCSCLLTLCQDEQSHIMKHRVSSQDKSCNRRRVPQSRCRIKHNWWSSMFCCFACCGFEPWLRVTLEESLGKWACHSRAQESSPTSSGPHCGCFLVGRGEGPERPLKPNMFCK